MGFQVGGLLRPQIPMNGATVALSPSNVGGGGCATCAAGGAATCATCRGGANDVGPGMTSAADVFTTSPFLSLGPGGGRDQAIGAVIPTQFAGNSFPLPFAGPDAFSPSTTFGFPGLPFSGGAFPNGAVTVTGPSGSLNSILNMLQSGVGIPTVQLGNVFSSFPGGTFAGPSFFTPPSSVFSPPTSGFSPQPLFGGGIQLPNPFVNLGGQAPQVPAQQPVMGGPVNLRGINDPTLQRNLSLIAADPEGATLMREAARRGVSISVGDPGGGPNVLGITRSVGNNSTIVVRDPNNIKTIVHELVHAVSTEDGNSQTEEGLANVIGKRVESRLRGIALENPNVTFNNTLPQYRNLQALNAIRDTLTRLGISV